MLEIEIDGKKAQVPDGSTVMDAARTYVHEGVAPGGTHANWRFLADWVTWGEGVSKEEQLLLADAARRGIDTWDQLVSFLRTPRPRPVRSALPRPVTEERIA